MELIEKKLNKRIQKLINRYHKQVSRNQPDHTGKDSRRIRWIQRNLELDGIQLRESELRSILDAGKIPGEMPLTSVVHALNLNDAYRLVEKSAEQGESLTEGLILRIHRLALRNLSDETAGQYRHATIRKKGGFAPPAPRYIPELIQDLCHWYKSYGSRLDPQDLAFWAHHRIIFIRPFTFGSEVTARHVLNFILFSFQLPPLLLDQDSKSQYEHLNHEANLDTYPGYMTFLGEMLEKSLIIELESPVLSGDDSAELTMKQASEISGISREKLSRDARKGILHATRNKRSWVTTRTDLEDYLKNH